MAQSIQPMQFVVSIVERGKGKRIIEYYRKHGILQHIRTTGYGTAASHMLDTLGFGTTERDVIISCGQKNTVRQFMEHLRDNERPKLDMRGIAFSVNISGMSAIMAVCISRMEESENTGEGGTYIVDKNNTHSLLLISVNQGYTNAVMDTAKKAGAKGGTVVRARWTGAEDVQDHTGIPMQAEKELLAIVVKNDDRNAIMEEIEKAHSLREEAQGVVASIPIDYTSRID